MKLSFVIPAYNEETLIGECLKAISKATESKKYDIEVIVVDNASTDKTTEIAGSFEGVKIVKEPHKGIVWARKAGFLASTGDLIANIDADGILPPLWLDSVFSEFNKDPLLLALSGPYIYYDLSFSKRLMTKFFYVIGYISDWFNGVFFNKRSMLQGGNYVVRREALLKIGGFDTTIEFYGEDTDMGRRLHKIGKVKWTFSLPMYTSGRRLKGEGIITVGLKYAINYLWTTFIGKPFSKNYSDIRPK